MTDGRGGNECKGFLKFAATCNRCTSLLLLRAHLVFINRAFHCKFSTFSPGLNNKFAQSFSIHWIPQ